MAQLLIRGQRPHYRHSFIIEELGFRVCQPGERLDLDDTMIQQLCDKYGACVERVEKPEVKRRPPTPKNRMEPEPEVVKADDIFAGEAKEV